MKRVGDRLFLMCAIVALLPLVALSCGSDEAEGSVATDSEEREDIELRPELASVVSRLPHIDDFEMLEETVYELGDEVYGKLLLQYEDYARDYDPDGTATADERLAMCRGYETLALEFMVTRDAVAEKILSYSDDSASFEGYFGRTPEGFVEAFDTSMNSFYGDTLDSSYRILRKEFDADEPDNRILASLVTGIQPVYEMDFFQEYTGQWQREFEATPEELLRIFEDPGETWVYIEKYQDRN